MHFIVVNTRDHEPEIGKWPLHPQGAGSTISQIAFISTFSLAQDTCSCAAPIAAKRQPRTTMPPDSLASASERQGEGCKLRDVRS